MSFYTEVNKSEHPLYPRWCSMLARCNNPKHHSYPKYGGRGIRVCKEWESFERFVRDVGLPPQPGMQMDRIDNDKGYEPSNCRWISPKENNRNRSISRMLTCEGVTKTLSEWAEGSGVLSDTIAYRLKAGWTLKQAISVKTNGKRHTILPHSSKHRGVRWDAKRQRWLAIFYCGNKKTKQIGAFHNEADAAHAYQHFVAKAQR